MKKMYYHSLTLLFCLLMTALHAGVASNECSKISAAKKCCVTKQKQPLVTEKEAVADFILTNRILLF